MKPPTLSYLADVYFGPDSLRDVSQVLHRFNIERPLIVTDPGVFAAGLVGRVGLPDAPVFQEIETNPTEQSVLEGLAVYREYECDGLLAVGGGSPMDCAKCIALLVTHPQPLEQYAFIRGGMPKIRPDMPPVICVPTTAGTGSEVGRAALITLESRQKLAILSSHMIPDAAVCDPTLTLELPAGLTAATGMDAVAHCIETFLSPRFNPVAEAIALDALKRAVTYLPVAVHQGSDLNARSEMMMAALEAGLTFQKGLGAIHALSHPLGAVPGKRLHHGTLNAILLPHVLRFNAGACPEKVNRLADTLGVERSADAVVGFFETFIRSIGLPARLREAGVALRDLDAVIDGAVKDHCSATNPRPASRDDYRSLLQLAL